MVYTGKIPSFSDKNYITRILHLNFMYSLMLYLRPPYFVTFADPTSLPAVIYKQLTTYPESFNTW